jgi:hypothetical protein
MFDLYGLPSDFPGKNSYTRNPADPTPYVEALENSFGSDIGCPQFVPYLQLHEYETLLFTDPRAFEIAFEDCQSEIVELNNVASSAPSIEHIDDGKETAPSKRIISIIPEYEGRKVSAGPDIAEYIGLPAVRSKCPHFDSWLTRLEELEWQSD